MASSVQQCWLRPQDFRRFSTADCLVNLVPTLESCGKELVTLVKDAKVEEACKCSSQPLVDLLAQGARRWPKLTELRDSHELPPKALPSLAAMTSLKELEIVVSRRTHPAYIRLRS